MQKHVMALDSRPGRTASFTDTSGSCTERWTQCSQGSRFARPDRPLVPVLFLLGAMCIGVMLYFLPSMVAMARGHENKLAIVILNLLLGWTFLGWVGALVWSLTVTRRTHAGGGAG